jgi:hypothetical protein
VLSQLGAPRVVVEAVPAAEEAKRVVPR